jgi:hypothetical protein
MRALSLAALHWPSASLRRCGSCRTRRRSGVNRTRAGLWRNHSALRNNRLAGCWLGRSRGSNWSCRLGRRSRCRSFRRCRRRRSHCRCRRRNYHCRRRSRLFCRWRSDHHGGRLGHRRRDDDGFFRRKRSRFRHHNCSRFLCGRNGRCNRRLRLHRRRCGWLGRYWRYRNRTGGGRRWLLLLLFALPEQSRHVSGLMYLGEIDLRLGFSRGFLFGPRAGLRGEMPAHPFRFILLN